MNRAPISFLESMMAEILEKAIAKRQDKRLGSVEWGEEGEE
jgi:hypothetical protein